MSLLRPKDSLNTAAESAQADAYKQAAGVNEASDVNALDVVTVKRWLNWKIAALVGVLTLLIVGGAAAYFLVYLSPQHVLYRAATKLVSAHSLQFEGNVVMKQTGSDSAGLGLVNATIQYSGGYDALEANNPKALLKLGAEGEVAEFGKGSAQVELRYLKNTVYGAITKAPQSKLLNLKPFENYWVSFDTASEKDSQGKTAADYLKPPTKQDAKKIDETLKKYPVVKDIEIQKDEKVNGEPTRHYRLRIDYDHLKEFFLAAAPVVMHRDLTAEERDSFGKDFVTPKRNDPIDVWVSKRDGTFYQVKSHDEVTGTEPGSTSLVTDTTLVMTKYNKPLPVAAPPQSVTTKQLEQEAVADTDHDGLANLEERYFGTDPKQRDSDKDGHTDGAEVRQGFKPKGPGRLPEQDLLQSYFGTAASPESSSRSPQPRSSQTTYTYQ